MTFPLISRGLRPGEGLQGGGVATTFINPKFILLGCIGSEFFLVFSCPMIEVIRTGDAPALVPHEQKLSKTAEHLPCSDPSLRTGCSQWWWNPGSLGKFKKSLAGINTEMLRVTFQPREMLVCCDF